jgi:hypothetical protein
LQEGALKEKAQALDAREQYISRLEARLLAQHKLLRHRPASLTAFRAEQKEAPKAGTKMLFSSTVLRVQYC